MSHTTCSASASASATTTPTDVAVHELHFQSLFREGRALSFPCDAQGRVDLDRLSERARCNCLFARGLIGRDFTHPTVRAAQAALVH